jgi:hypothetical protein
VNGNLDPSARITQRFPLEEAEVAYRLLRAGEIVGRAPIQVEDRPSAG